MDARNVAAKIVGTGCHLRRHPDSTPRSVPGSLLSHRGSLFPTVFPATGVPRGRCSPQPVPPGAVLPRCLPRPYAAYSAVVAPVGV